MRYVRAVVAAGSFSAAAKSYGVTQPALSNGIARLEKVLGDRLFDRSPRGVTLTDFGETMLPRIENTLAALDEVHAEAHRWHTSTPETIRVGVSPLIDSALVAAAHRVISMQVRSETRRRLVLHEANMGDLRTALALGDLDIVIVPSVEPMPEFVHRIVHCEPLVLVEPCPDDSTARLTDLADRQLILLPDTCGLTRFTHSLLAEYELPINAYPGEAGSYRVLEEWSHLGLGSAVLPRSKLAAPDSPYRQILDADECVVEICYEAVWDPNSLLADELAYLADRLTQAGVSSD